MDPNERKRYTVTYRCDHVSERIAVLSVKDRRMISVRQVADECRSIWREEPCDECYFRGLEL